MRIEDQERSSNIEDRRGMSVGRGVAGGGIGIVVIALIAMFLGVDPSLILQSGMSAGGPAPGPQQAVEAKAPSRGDQMADFVAAVLGSTEEVWTDIFARAGRTYRKPTLVLFTGQVQSACGYAQAAVGPFYCPADQKLYIDLAFYRDLQDRFKAPGDFAQAYVIAHEVGHHVQNLLGIAERVQGMQQRAGKQQANALSVRMELQADCFAGDLGGAGEPEAPDPRAGRRRGGPRRRRGGRRRPHPDGLARLRVAGVLHARQCPAARALVPARARHRRSEGLRRVRRRAALGPG